MNWLKVKESTTSNASSISEWALATGNMTGYLTALSAPSRKRNMKVEQTATTSNSKKNLDTTLRASQLKRK
jgi:hypothetical protein